MQDNQDNQKKGKKSDKISEEENANEESDEFDVESKSEEEADNKIKELQQDIASILEKRRSGLHLDFKYYKWSDIFKKEILLQKYKAEQKKELGIELSDEDFAFLQKQNASQSNEQIDLYNEAYLSMHYSSFRLIFTAINRNSSTLTFFQLIGIFRNQNVITLVALNLKIWTIHYFI